MTTSITKFWSILYILFFFFLGEVEEKINVKIIVSIIITLGLVKRSQLRFVQFFYNKRVKTKPKIILENL